MKTTKQILFMIVAACLIAIVVAGIGYTVYEIITNHQNITWP
jgi:uncharacterized membrane protein YjfL (UPF0719 family)